MGETAVTPIEITKPISQMTKSEIKALIAQILAQINILRAQLAEIQAGEAAGIPTACTGVKFTRTLKLGMSGTDVKCLQALLNRDPATRIASTGLGSPGQETTYFGDLTKLAVIKFQEKYASEILAPNGLVNGTGLVGSSTIAKLNALLGK